MQFMYQYELFASMCSQWLKKTCWHLSWEVPFTAMTKTEITCVFPASKKHIVIPNPSTININTKTSPFSVFIGMISSNTCMIQRKRLQAISFSTAKALKSQRFKESSFPKAIMETAGSRNRCLLWDILCQKLQKNNVFSNKKLTNLHL